MHIATFLTSSNRNLFNTTMMHCSSDDERAEREEARQDVRWGRRFNKTRARKSKHWQRANKKIIRERNSDKERARTYKQRSKMRQRSRKLERRWKDEDLNPLEDTAVDPISEVDNEWDCISDDYSYDSYREWVREYLWRRAFVHYESTEEEPPPATINALSGFKRESLLAGLAATAELRYALVTGLELCSLGRASTNDNLLSGLVSLPSAIRHQIISMLNFTHPGPFAPGVYAYHREYYNYDTDDSDPDSRTDFVYVLILYPGLKLARTMKFLEGEEVFNIVLRCLDWEVRTELSDLEALLDVALDPAFPLSKVECTGETIKTKCFVGTVPNWVAKYRSSLEEISEWAIQTGDCSLLWQIMPLTLV